jgi:PilZ domain-containing protein
MRGPRIPFRGLARVVAPGLSRTGELVNLSVGGAFLVVDGVLQVGQRLTITLQLGDGKPPIAAHATVAWTRPLDDCARFGLGLRFVRIADESAHRIAQQVAGFSAPRDVLLGPVRVQLPGVPTKVRARASERTTGTLVLESELSWLRVGGAVSIEVSPDDVRFGRLSWFGVEVAADGHARLLFTVDVVAPPAPSGTDDDAPDTVVVDPLFLIDEAVPQPVDDREASPPHAA